METNDKVQVQISRLIDEHGLQRILQAIASDVSRRERLIEEKSDRNLSAAVEAMFPLLVDAQPKVGKKLGSFIKMILGSISVKESLKVIKADSSNQSPAVKEAYLKWKEMKWAEQR